MQTVNEFCQFSGLQISYEIMQIMPLSSGDSINIGMLNTAQPVAWVHDMKVLELCLVPDTERLVQLNMSNLVKKLETTIHS